MKGPGMGNQRTIPFITHAELRMLQGLAAILVAEAAHSPGLSRCRFGRFELTAKRLGSNDTKEKIAIELIVSDAGEIIEHDLGLLPRH